MYVSPLTVEGNTISIKQDSHAGGGSYRTTFNSSSNLAHLLKTVQTNPCFSSCLQKKKRQTNTNHTTCIHSGTRHLFTRQLTTQHECRIALLHVLCCLLCVANKWTCLPWHWKVHKGECSVHYRVTIRKNRPLPSAPFTTWQNMYIRLTETYTFETFKITSQTCHYQEIPVTVTPIHISFSTATLIVRNAGLLIRMLLFST